MSRRLIKFFQDANARRKEAQWAYGTLLLPESDKPRVARRNTMSGKVQFIPNIKKDGDPVDTWLDVHKSWWRFFKPTMADDK